MLEEKNKLMEMMNEANHVFEENRAIQQSRTLVNPGTPGLYNQLERQGRGTEELDIMIQDDYVDIVGEQNIDNPYYEVKLRVQAHQDQCSAMCYSPVGDYIVTGGLDKAINVWNSRTL